MRRETRMLRAVWQVGIGMAAILAGVAMLGSRARAGEVESGLDSCDRCGMASNKVQGEIDRLLGARHSWTRDDAAHDLRRFDWRCHPEILDALVTALLRDPKAHVRSEAAQTLLAIEPVPCLPGVHAALAKAASGEPNLCARLWVRKALKRIERKCPAPCSACDACTSAASAIPLSEPEPVFNEAMPPAVLEKDTYQAERPRVVPAPRETQPLEMWPESRSNLGPQPERDLAPAAATTSAPARVPAPPRPAPHVSSDDLFGPLPPLDAPNPETRPLPGTEPRYSEPDMLPPAPSAEEAGPFERSSLPDRAQREPRKERFASDRPRMAERTPRDRDLAPRTFAVHDADEMAERPGTDTQDDSPSARPRRRLLPLRLFGGRSR